MSLHLGNLSSRVRIDELERVFQRFGRCNVRVKDRFGFVVYDFPGNAEKALRTLRGKRICGESITISWSNRQPIALQRTVKGGRSLESHHGRNSARENYVNRKLGSDGRRKFRMGFKQSDADGRRFSSADLPEEETTSYDQDHAKGCTSEKDQNVKEDLADEGGGSKSIFLDNDRWEEQVGSLSNENGIGFDRYEPYHVDGDDRKDMDEMNHAINRGGSPVGKDSQDKRGIVKSDDATLNPPGIMKSKQTCYICGDLGHKMRNCPRGKDVERKKSRFDHRRDDKINYSGKGEYKLQRGGSKAQGSQRPGRNVMVRAHKSDRDSSRSRKLRQLTKSGDFPVENETNRSHTNKHGEKKRSRRENGSPEGQHAKKSKSSVLTPVHSDFTASKSKTKRSASRSNSPSRLRFRSLSSLSSSSTSHHTRSRKCKSRSRLRSRSKSRSRSRSRSGSATCLSLSASVSRSLLSSPNKEQMKGGNSSVKAASPESKEISFVRGQLVETDAGSGDSKLETVMIAVENGSTAPFKADEDVDKNHSQKKSDDNLALSKDSAEGTNICASQLKEADLSGGYLSPNSQRETRDPQNGDRSISEHVLVTTKNPESEVVLRSHVSSKSITSEEMHMALKHYGMQHQEENEKDLPVETYFGSARLWPWEIIYFRRLRKGPISTENYARRIAQNEEFGIVDKYVRSSSGWGEREEHDF